MKCPTCPSASLVISERSGVEIDYCPQCRGVWLDRGELDKLLQRADNWQSTYTRPVPQHYPSTHYPSTRRPKSWLAEIFD